MVVLQGRMKHSLMELFYQVPTVLRFGMESVTKYFKRQEIVDFEMEMAALRKEKRMEIKKRKELPWRKKKEEYALRNVAKDWIIENKCGGVCDTY